MLLSHILPQSESPVQEAHFDGGNLCIDGNELKPGNRRFTGDWIKTLCGNVICGEERFFHCLWAFECTKHVEFDMEFEGVIVGHYFLNCGQGPVEGYFGARRSFMIEGIRYMEYHMLILNDLPPAM